MSSSVSGSSTVNGLYSNPNQISGLVSGLDTESMIEGLVSSYSQKIIGYQQDIVMQQWQQEAYRDVITDLVNFTSKYTSFTSDTNIFSNAFFNGATTSVAGGSDSDKISVSGTSDSTIEITSVLSTASSARLETSALQDDVNSNYISGTTADLASTTTVGALDGYMTFSFGNTTVDIDWTQDDRFFSVNADGSTNVDGLGQELADKINDKLAEVNFSVGGTSLPASDRFEAVYDSGTGTITFKDLTGGGNQVEITAASSSIKDALGLNITTSAGDGDIKIGDSYVSLDSLSKQTTGYSEISGQTMNITYNGTTKVLTMPTIEEDLDDDNNVKGFTMNDTYYSMNDLDALNDAIAADMQTSMDKLFGEGAISVGNAGSSGSFDADAFSGLGSANYQNDVSTALATITSDQVIANMSAEDQLLDIGTDAYQAAYTASFNDLSAPLLTDINDSYLSTVDGMSDDNKDVMKYMGFDPTSVEDIIGFAEYLTQTQADSTQTNAELIASEFGSGKLGLNFTINNLGNNTLNINAGTLGQYLGLDTNEANYIVTSNSLGDLIGTDGFPAAEAILNEDYDPDMTTDSDDYDKDKNYTDKYIQPVPEEGEAYLTANGSITLSSSGTYYYDSDGDRLDKIVTDDDEEIWVKVDSDGKHRIGTAITINDVEVGVFDAESSLQDVLDAINNSDAGVTASFSSLTNKIVFTTNETGVGQRIDIESNHLTNSLFGEPEDLEDSYTAGTSCIMIAQVNGEEVMLVRDSNAVNIDGLTVTVKETFGNTYEDEEGNTVTVDSLEEYVETSDKIDKSSITFTEEIDADPLVDAISQMVDDYNALMAKLKTYLTEVPLTNSSGTSYLPLTDEDSSTMTESAIDSYEEKAKTGILFGDSNIRSLYSSLGTVFSASSSFGMDLYSMGFDVGYGTSLSVSSDMVTLDTDKLKEFMSTKSGVEKVRNAFVSSLDNGGSADGVMQNLKSRMEQYGAVTGSTKGILVEAAGSELSSLSLMSNSMQTKIDTLNELIEAWEEKLSNKVTYYTSQFTALEVLMSEMNSQSSALAGLSSSY